MPEQILHRVLGAAEKIKIKSALTPMLWLCLITLPILYNVINQEAPAPWKIVVAGTPLAITVLGFLFLLFFDRNKLQSEEYQLDKQYMELIENKGQVLPIPAVLIESIPKPQSESLGDEE